jgi:succinate-acetate transporter protein
MMIDIDKQPVVANGNGGLVHRRSKKHHKSKNYHSVLVADEIRRLSSHVHPPVPNPAPLGLIAFGLTTALLQVKHIRLVGEEELDGVDNLVLGFALCFGGLIQLIAGISEIRRNNIFGYTAFCVYGGFWMSVGTVHIVELLAAGDTSPHISPKANQAMLSIMAIVTAMLWSLTFKINKTICMLFLLLFMTFILLAIGVSNEVVDQIGGYVGILTSANAFWLAFAELVNDVVGEGTVEIIPLGHWETNKFKKAGGAHVPGLIHGSSRPQDVSQHQSWPQGDLEEELEDLEEGVVKEW